MRDLRYALRALRRNPGLTIAAVFVLALGIGAGTAVFSAVYAILLKPLPYADPGHLAVALHDGKSPVSAADFIDYKAQSSAFTDMAAAEAWGGLMQSGERLEMIRGMQVTPNMLPLLGVEPMIGRGFRENEEGVLLLSYKLWQRRFGSDPKVVNSVVNVSGKPFTVTGVMGPKFQFAPFWQSEAEMWTSLSIARRANDRKMRTLRVFARLKSGVSIAQAQTQMSAIAARLAAAYPASNTNLDIQVVSLQEKAAGPVRPVLGLLLRTVGFVLVIACADIGSLLLARAASRRREIATRIALGASRFQLSRHLAFESLLLSGMGGLIGILLARVALHVLSGSMPASGLPRQAEIGLNTPVLLFALAVSVVAGLAAGLIPSLQSGRVDVNESLKEGGRGSSLGRGSRRAQNILIASQVALAMVLLICAGLLGRSLRNLNSVDPGFDPGNVLTFEVTTAAPNPTALAQIEQTLRSDSRVESVSAINHLPIGGDVWTLPYDVVGRPAPLPGHEFGAVYRVVRPEYFKTMRIRVNGRDFTTHDDANAPGVVIVNETLARKQWPGESGIGKQISFQQQRSTVIGVSTDVRQSDWTSPVEDEIYLPYLQRPTAMGMNTQAFVVRTRGNPARLASHLNFAVAVSQVRTMERVIDEKLWRSRIAAWLLSSFAAIALALATAGIYGVIAYSVRTRSQEIGIRIALGSTGAGILGLLARETALPIGLGFMAGVAGAIAATRLLSTLLYNVRATDPATFAAVTAAMLIASAAAIALPARTRGDRFTL